MTTDRPHTGPLCEIGIFELGERYAHLQAASDGADLDPLGAAFAEACLAAVGLLACHDAWRDIAEVLDTFDTCRAAS